MMCRRPYDTDLTDPEWEILNGIFYAVRSGCAWKLLPHDLPPWRTVYHYFWFWRRNTSGFGAATAHGRRFTIVFAHWCGGQQADIRNRAVPSSTASPCRTTEQGGVRGYDAAKNVSGRKRHVLVDTLGLVLLVVVTAANAQDRAAARILLSMLVTRFRRLRGIWADGAYAGSGLQQWVRRLRPWGKVRLEIVRKPKGQSGFAVLPWRWIIERTFAWLGRWRRLKADYECLPETTEALIHIAMIRLMLRRLVQV